MVLIVASSSLLVLFTLGAFFSAAETVMTALNRIDISALKEQYPSYGKKIEKLMERPDRIIASLLIGNNIANISASAIVAYITNYYLGGIFIPLSTAALTIIIIVFCEITPKQLAFIYKRQIAVASILPITFFYVLFSPLLVLALWLIRVVFPILKRQKLGENFEESLEHMIELAGEHGFINQYERDFINNVLDLNDKTVKQIMTHRQDVFSVEAGASLAAVYPEMVENSYSRVPVYQENLENIVGILYLGDVQKFYIAQSKDRSTLQEQAPAMDLATDFAGVIVRQLMKPVSFLPDSVRVSDLFFHFKKTDSNLAIILDEYGGLGGVVSQEDVLEAVFGKLYDEDEKEQESALLICKESTGSFVFSGMLSIQQFEEFFDISIPIEENTRLATISGYLCDIVGSIPEPGKIIAMPSGKGEYWEGNKVGNQSSNTGTFQVLESDGKRIVRLRFQPAGVASINSADQKMTEGGD